ncbi:D-2-hydroxyacid dehydrogenase family protein [Alicyclobacillus kakegawensis]|uniref:D-2-hydroxyacid dehydrogenase family protein n=1 Tax=Alicyclobacillus kakegawensis TaxID=392012 RepID=UPI0008307150|nr:D-2-hydroxyacid dehydrogenase family protein [Alicyclobacillus kakegawensis]
MKLRCAILDDYQQIALSIADWTAITDRVEVIPFHHHFDHEDSLVEAIRDFDMVVIMRERTPFPASLFDRLPRLRLLVTTGMRNAAVDMVAAASHGVTVCGTDGSSYSTSELTWALILGLARNIVKENHSFRSNGVWQSTIGTDLHGKTLGIIGLGRIGRQVARVGIAFGMKVTAWSQNLTEEQAMAAGVQFAASKDILLETSDFVSIHLVLSDRTRGLIGRSELQRMKRTAYLINTSRAPIVDQSALEEALRNQTIAGAGLDVFEVEPLPQDHPYRTLPNVLATPHLGYVSLDTYKTWYRQVVEDIDAFLSGAPVRQLN